MENPFDQGYFGTDELRGFGFKCIGENVRIARTCKIVGLENIEIGDNSRIDDFCVIVGSGPLVLRNWVHIHAYCQIGVKGGVIMDDFTALASGCLVYSASDDPIGRYMIGGAVPQICTQPRIAPVHFQRHSGMFAHCTALPGVTMHEGAIACAHSLVTRSISEWTLVQGAPAKYRMKRSRRLLRLSEGNGAPIEHST